MNYLSWIVVVLLLVGGAACAKEKPKPLIPLALDPGAKPQAVTLTEQGTQAFKSRQFDEAKTFFSQAMAAAPQSGQAHYNYALTIYSMGNIEEARQHFLDAANLAPGDKTIWDSPALRQYGDPQVPKTTKQHDYGTTRPTFGGGPR